MIPVTPVPFARAKDLPGVRLVVIDRMPTPWVEAAKAVFVFKDIPFTPINLKADDPEQVAWSGASNAPVVRVDDEAPVSGWRDILALGERLAPTPALLSRDPSVREEMLGLCAELADPNGLGWCRRNAVVHASLVSEGKAGFSVGLSKYLGGKYGYDPARIEESERREVELLERFTQRLRHAKGFLFSETELSAPDLYLAAFLAMYAPLPDERYPIHPRGRAAFALRSTVVSPSLKPELFAHREKVLSALASHLPRTAVPCS